VTEFGINAKNVFAFWDWVGGRYSVTSAVGLLPLSLQYGFEVVQSFLNGARSIDQHFFQAPPQKNIPVILGKKRQKNCALVFLKHLVTRPSWSLEF
jgi:glucose-6-phosphate isomerase